MALMGVISFGLLEAAFGPGAPGWQPAGLGDTVVVGDLRKGVRSFMPGSVSRVSTG